jgi:hypothetical protein
MDDKLLIQPQDTVSVNEPAFWIRVPTKQHAEIADLLEHGSSCSLHANTSSKTSVAVQSSESQPKFQNNALPPFFRIEV